MDGSGSTASGGRRAVFSMPVTLTLVAVLLATTVLLRHVSPPMANALSTPRALMSPI